ncbi:acyl-CoA dehydrogenase [Kitasatospora sp. NPDC002227]|uniref:acyl-CoA dehydrogenase n=1 Tax=Kitasatospora sp. NPDC002227 TaxID=3154773 RepID=UPI00332A534A
MTHPRRSSAAPCPGSATELDQLRHGSCPPTVRRAVAELLAVRPVPAEPEALGRDHHDHHMLRRLAEALPPAAEVFADTDLLATLSAATALADPSLYQAFLSHYILCVGSVSTLAGQRSTPWAEEGPPPGSAELARVQAKGVFMVTEIGDASSHLGTRTTASYDPERDEFVLHTPDARAAKFSSVGAPGRGLPQQAVVVARLVVGEQDHGVFSFLVGITDADGRPLPGVSVSSPVAVDVVPLPYAVVRFHQARLPRSAWLRDCAQLRPDGTVHDPLGSHDARLQRTLSVGQTLWATLPTAMAAVASRAAVLALRCSTARRSHGRLAPGAPVLSYRTQQHAVLGALAEAFALTCAAGEARRAWASARPVPAPRPAPGGPEPTVPTAGPAPEPGGEMTFSPWAAVSLSLAVHKALSARAAAALIADCQHRCGLAGLHRANRLQGYHDLARAFENAGGDSTLILLDAGRALVTGKPADPPRPDPVPPLTDPAWWPGLAGALQHRLTEELQSALDERSQTAASGLDLWNGLLAQTLELGECHALRLAADSLADGLAEIADPVAREALGLLAALYGVRQARRQSGPLLRTGLLTPSTARALPAALDTLCDALQPHLPLLAEVLDPAEQGPGEGVPLGSPEFAEALTGTLTWRRGAR